jgi:DNA-binding beta-propeller fold protein YncE
MRRLVLAVLGLLVVAGCGGSGDDEPTAGPPWVRVGSGPVGVAADPDGSVWVANAGDDSVSHVIGRAAHREPDVGDTPLRLAADGTGVWATSFGDGRLLHLTSVPSRIDKAGVMGDGPEGVVLAHGSVWVVVQDAGLLRQVRPRDARVVRAIRVGNGARLVAADATHVWVSQFAQGVVLRVDPASGAVTRSGPVCPHPQGLLPTADKVWVTCTSVDKVVALDPDTLEVLATVDVPGQPDPVVAGPDGEVVVVAEDGPTVYRLDPADGHVVDKHRLGTAAPLDDEANIDAAVIQDGTLWVTSYREDRVYYRALS